MKRALTVALAMILTVLICAMAYAGAGIDQTAKDLAAGNLRFVAGKPAPKDLGDTRRHELLKGQHPFATILTCSDSRVPPELIFDQGLGELFVVRNAGNVIDNATLGTIEYGVEHLHTPVLMVMGHQHCGAVKATFEVHGKSEGNIAAILTKITPSVDKVRASGKTGEEAVDLAVIENVRNSAKEIKEKSPVVSELMHEGKLRMILAVYHLDTGKVEIVEEVK